MLEAAAGQLLFLTRYIRVRADCEAKLQDDSLLWIMLIGQSAQIVPHVVALAETVKRQRYKASAEELKQFIDDGPV